MWVQLKKMLDTYLKLLSKQNFIDSFGYVKVSHEKLVQFAVSNRSNDATLKYIMRSGLYNIG